MPELADVEELIGSLPCLVELPESVESFFARRGPLPTRFGDERQYPRYYCRAEAALRCRPSLPAIERQAAQHRIYVRDISRSSVSFYHSEQLFPLESAELMLSDGLARSLQIIRCRKIQRFCYEVVGCFSAVQPSVEA